MIHKHLREGIKAEFPSVSWFSRKILCRLWHNEMLIQAKNNPEQYAVAQIPSKMHLSLWIKCVKLGSSIHFKYIKQVFRYKRMLFLTFFSAVSVNLIKKYSLKDLPSVICDALQLHLSTLTLSVALKKSSQWTFLFLKRRNWKVLAPP